MSEYRIKREFNSYTVEKKGWFFWHNCIMNWECGVNIPKIFHSYEAAKAALEIEIKNELEAAEYYAAKKAFKTQYYYPPMPDKEPNYK